MADDDPTGGIGSKYFALAAVAVTALFLGFLWGNQSKTGKLTIGDSGVHVEISDRERIESVIDKLLNENTTSPYERQALITHMISVIRKHAHESDIGQEIVEAANKSEGPFYWEYRDVDVRYDPTISAPIFYVCKEDTSLQGVISVQVLDGNNGFMDVGKEHQAIPHKQCGTDQSVVFTGYKELVEAAEAPGRLAKARKVVTFPRR
ncbi:hypothetical protein KBY96_12715 [Cyanobium sp. ATX 6A2]|uniref:hypothetical protein n=1 Tax=Cyanobium sp. ATX 6A2 TaxID=2823700 RepID=UPI0020CD73E3|nr:hypothetical protein [Cyanobium sp. ATX 6A2]MCP9888786.1 hypothetical protein [Cyanobium sp. ATX 6A2]